MTEGAEISERLVREIAPGLFATAPEDSLSPSLQKGREEPAYEMKFLLERGKVAAVSDWAGQHLQRDPHADPARGHQYRIHSLYFDTAELDVLHKSPGFKRKKYRIRRYGGETFVYLEQKRKTGDRVAKRRVGVDNDEIDRLRDAVLDPEWLGHWFQHRIARRRLRPTCQISYDRQAYFTATSEGGPIRLTLDRGLICRPADGWTVGEIEEGTPLLFGETLLELKFSGHLPALFKSMLQDQGIVARPLSKYRLAAAACGLDSQAGRPTHA